MKRGTQMDDDAPDSWNYVCPYEDCPYLKSNKVDEDCGQHEDWMT